MWLGVVAWLSCDCIIHELVDRGSWTGIRGLILVIVWGYGVGVMRSLTGFMGMVVRFLGTLIPGG